MNSPDARTPAPRPDAEPPSPSTSALTDGHRLASDNSGRSVADSRSRAVPVDSRRADATDGRRWASTDLFGSSSEIEIEHGAAVYRLRRTSLGKLILTK